MQGILNLAFGIISQLERIRNIRILTSTQTPGKITLAESSQLIVHIQ